MTELNQAYVFASAYFSDAEVAKKFENHPLKESITHEDGENSEVNFVVPETMHSFFMGLLLSQGASDIIAMGQGLDEPIEVVSDEMRKKGSSIAKRLNPTARMASEAYAKGIADALTSMTDNKERHPDEALFDTDSTATNLQEACGCAFTQEEAKAISAGFGGDVRRASKLYRELTDDYVSHMTVEELIKAGNG